MRGWQINTFRKANRPGALVADKGYSSRAIRSCIEKRAPEDVISTPSSQTRNCGFDKKKSKLRNVIGRTTGWFKE